MGIIFEYLYFNSYFKTLTNNFIDTKSIPLPCSSL